MKMKFVKSLIWLCAATTAWVASAEEPTIKSYFDNGSIKITNGELRELADGKVAVVFTDVEEPGAVNVASNLLVTADFLLVGGGGNGGKIADAYGQGANGGDAGEVKSVENVRIREMVTAVVGDAGAASLVVTENEYSAAGGHEGSSAARPIEASANGSAGAGTGTTSDITGESVVYGIGGAGGAGAGNSPTDGANAAPNTGNGGGGAGAGCDAGAGATGIVVIKVTAVEVKAIDLPTPAELTYNKAAQTPLETTSTYIVCNEEGSVRTATNAGTYVVKVKPAAGYWWTDTLDSSTRDVEWSIKPLEIDKPTATPSSIDYDGNEHTVIASENEAYEYIYLDEQTGYALTVTNATHAGMYTLTAELQNPEGVTNYVWKGEAIDYHRSTGVGYWRIASITVPRPVYESEFVYSGTNNVAVTIGEHMQLVDVVEGVASVTNATDVGTYSFRIKLDNEEGESDYVWADGENPTAADLLVSWRIKKATNEITSFEYPGWRIGAGAPAPEVSTRFGEATLTFAASEDAEEEEWTSEVPQEPGTWYVRAFVPGTANYTSAEEIKSFFLWRGAEDIFTDFVEITVPGYTATQTLNGFVIPVRLSETLMPGFKYNRVGSSEGLAFMIGDDFLAYDVELWDPTGESVVWVKIPELTAETKIKVCWHGANGPTIAGSNSAEVWSDYYGVWHFGEQIDATQAAKTVTKDSTGNGYDAMPVSYNSNASLPSKMISVPGVIGNARQNVDGQYVSGPRFEVKGSESLALNGSFTISGWYNLKQAGSGGNFGLFIASTKHSLGEATGWHVQPNSRNNRSLYGQGSTGAAVAATIGSESPIDAGWAYFAYTFDNTSLTVTGRIGEQKATNSGTIAKAGDNGRKISFGNFADNQNQQSFIGYYDEFRISKAPRTAEWLNLEHASVADPAFTEKSLVVVEGKKVNDWKSLPSVAPLSWNIADVESGKTSITVEKGTLREGEVKVTYYRFEDTKTPLEVTDPAEIKNAGRYFAVFTMVDETGYEPISYAIEFTVVVHMPYTDLGGNAGDSGRVLLMNRDLNPKGPVDYQGYYDTTPDEKTTYWEHLKLEELESSMNLMDATESVLMAANGRALWTLKDCRQGNVFLKESWDNLPLNAARAYLPWNSSTATRFDGRAEAALTRSGAGTIVMRNTTDAVITSSRFAEGIGTIYFDAVNNWVDQYGSNTVIAVEIENEFGEWIPVENVTVYKKDGTDGFVAEQLNGAAIPLAITTGGTCENFYRIAATVNTAEPTRMRIARKTFDDYAGPDQAALISIDNIIVSAPPMRADLEPTGFFDATKRGKEVLGWELATSVAYPKIGSDEIRPRAKVINVVNAGDGKEIDPKSFIASSILRYRWRYLGQALDPAEGWNSAALAWNEAGFLEATQPITVPDRIGDIEFYYETLLSAPYYEYVDYTGLDLGVAKTEEVEAVTNRREGETLPSGGKDWFFRLREGLSRYEAVKMIVERKGEEGYEPFTTVNFESTDDKQWRGFLKTTLDDKDTENRITFIALEPKDPTGEDTTLITNYWKAIQSVAEVPVAVTFDKTSEIDKWQNLKIDSVTGYLQFQLNEETHTIALTHADYQNFNGWNDAHKPGGTFVGNSTEEEKKVGVDETARDFAEDFATATDTPVTDTEWQESFTTGTLETYVPFQTMTTPNGWQAKQGQFVHQKFRQSVTPSSYALQIVGQGYGELEYPGLTRDPRGLESLSYRARLAQQMSFNDIGYYDVGKAGAKKMTNYTFIVQAAMSEHGWLTGTDRSDDDFDGAGQLSIVGAYQAGVGCYELRVTRIAVDRVLLELYKWKGNKATRVTSAEYGTTTFHKWRAKASDQWQYGTLFMSIDKQLEGVRITAGLSEGHSLLSTTSQTAKYHTIRFYDNVAPFEYGTFGVASANCPAVFAALRSYDAAVSWEDSRRPGMSGTYTGATITFNKGASETQSTAVDVGDWTLPSGRLVEFEDTDIHTERVGFKADIIPQTVKIQLKEKGSKTGWVTISEQEVSSFALADKVTVEVYRPEDATYRIVHGGTPDDARTDIVLDDVELRQFRGTDYGNYDTEYEPNDGYGWRDEFVYTGAWIKNNSVKLSAKRTLPGKVSGIRAPLMDGNGNPKRGLGLGMLSFAYENAQANARLLVQVATNNVSGTALVNEDDWVTVDTVDFAEMTADNRQSGVISKYLGLHEVKGLMRLIVDPTLILAVQNETDWRRFGEVTIRNILVRDEPKLTARSWWGWNIRLVNGDGSSSWDDGSRTYLYDWGVNAGDMGFSLALNNSVTANVIREEADLYKEHMPFLQTPTLLQSVIGEITFKARLFDATQERPAEIRLYGTTADKKYVDENDWDLIPDAHFIVTNDVYETYHYRTAGTNYRAMRLAVTGVNGVTLGAKGPLPDNPPASRVLIDEVVVGEAVFPKVGFRYVYPVRTELDTHAKSKAYDEDKDAANCDEQPLLGENWTVQAEIQVKQLPDEIDLTKTPIVKFYWIENTSATPWGYKNWCDLPGAHSAELQPIDDTWVFRGSFARTPSAIVQESEAEGTIVQYMASVTYWDKEGREHRDVMLDKSEWITPEWFNPVNPNKYQKDFSAFTILETIAPHRAWINETNVFDGYDSAGLPAAAENQYVEVAVPNLQSLEGWRLEYVDSNYNTYPLCTFGDRGVDAEVTDGPVTNDYTFLVVRSPASANGTVWFGKQRIDGSDVEFNGTWDSVTGELDIGFPIALRLIRPSDVVAQEIVLMGDNFWKGTAWEDQYSAEPFAEGLNSGLGGHLDARFYVVGDEIDNEGVTGPEGRSLGVFAKIGATKEEWNNTMNQTPGWVNSNQIVPKNYVIRPNSALVIVRAMLADAHLLQQVGDLAATTNEVKVTIPKNNPEGIKIIYTIADWYELGEVTTNAVAIASAPGSLKTFEIVVGANADKAIDVIASARPWEKLKEYDFDPEGDYAPAIMDWLSGGKNYFGEQFKNPGEINPAEYWNLTGKKESVLSLEDMYCLDIDPTEGNWRLVAGLTNVTTKDKPVAEPKLKLAGLGPDGDDHEGAAANAATQNLLVTLKMTITNTVSEVSYAPYIIRAKTPGMTSVDHASFADGIWDSASFKITGDLQNGNENRAKWVPLRWFYFLPDPGFDLSAAGLRQPRSASFDLNHEAKIEVWDPFEERGAGMTDGWDKYRGTDVWYRWSIDGRGMPADIEALKPDSTF